MLDETEARARAQAVLDGSASPALPVALLDERLESAHHWVFFYNSVAFLETGDWLHALAGNAPIVVPKNGDPIIRFSTATSPEGQLEALERAHL